jgi:cell division protein FtsQ
LQVRFGDSDFVNKYRLLIENLPHWRASVGRVESVDLRFSRQVVVNPESNRSARAATPGAPVSRGQ